MEMIRQYLTSSDAREIELLCDDERVATFVISDDGHISLRLLAELKSDTTIPLHFLMEAITDAVAISDQRFD